LLASVRALSDRSRREWDMRMRDTRNLGRRPYEGCSFLEENLGLEGFIEGIKEGSSSSKEIKTELFELDFTSLLEEY